MENNKSQTDQPGKSENESQNEDQQALPVHNPFDPNDKRQITQEDIDNEQKYKEALSERD
ncbi:MAG: hypothetical protein JWR18_3058 [Segetibacter sp.]|jgi:hypothetical protein|nr:hypothetical protein [Segetibacter sp.]